MECQLILAHGHVIEQSLMDFNSVPRNARNHENGSISAPMARQKLSMSEIPIARRAEAIGRDPGPWEEAPDPKNGFGGMAKPFIMLINSLFSPNLHFECPKHHLEVQNIISGQELSQRCRPRCDFLPEVMSLVQQ